MVDDTCATNGACIWAIGDVTQHGGFTHMAGTWDTWPPATPPNPTTHPTHPHRHPRRPPGHLHRPGGRVDRDDRSPSPRGRRTSRSPPRGPSRPGHHRGTDRRLRELIAGPRRIIGSTGGGHILGATIVAPTAGEMIHEAALAMKTNMFAGRLAQTTRAYPTWSMAIQQAATQFFYATDGLKAGPAQPTP